MDHHCPIIGRCIHMHNHKFFLLFLFWSTVLCGYAVCMVIPSLYQHGSIVLWSFSGIQNNNFYSSTVIYSNV